MNDEMREPEDVNPETAADIAEAATPDTEAVCPEQHDVYQLRALLTQCQQELAESKNAYLRAHADFDNFRKRMRAERDQEFSRGTDRVLSDLLPIVDDFERALGAVNEKSTVESVQKGVQLIYQQMQNLLERYNLKPMAVEGKPFDPHYHDAVARVATTAQPEHTIIGEVQRGYLKNGDVFRPARVAVAVSPEGSEEER